MTDHTAPERIWAWPWEVDRSRGQWTLNQSIGFDAEAEYIRADLHRADARAALRAHTEAAVRRALEAAINAAHEADSLELTLHGETKIAERIRALANNPAQFIESEKHD